MDLGLKDCKAFVAGASKGLGKACAKALAGEGARVFLCSRNGEELKRVAAEKASQRGRIVNLTGYGVKEPMTDLVVSDSIRAGVTVMAKTIASDLAPFGITVNNIAPGPIMTDRLTEILSARAKSSGVTPDELFKRFAATIPVRRMGQPNEIGDLCAYLCSPQAGYLTGQTIVVDGGVNRSI